MERERGLASSVVMSLREQSLAGQSWACGGWRRLEGPGATGWQDQESSRSTVTPAAGPLDVVTWPSGLGARQVAGGRQWLVDGEWGADGSGGWMAVGGRWQWGVDGSGWQTAVEGDGEWVTH